MAEVNLVDKDVSVCACSQPEQDYFNGYHMLQYNLDQKLQHVTKEHARSLSRPSTILVKT